MFWNTLNQDGDWSKHCKAPGSTLALWAWSCWGGYKLLLDCVFKALDPAEFWHVALCCMYLSALTPAGWICWLAFFSFGWCSACAMILLSYSWYACLNIVRAGLHGSCNVFLWVWLMKPPDVAQWLQECKCGRDHISLLWLLPYNIGFILVILTFH